MIFSESDKSLTLGSGLAVGELSPAVALAVALVCVEVDVVPAPHAAKVAAPAPTPPATKRFLREMEVRNVM
jgi:hypothetical protein